MLTKEANNMLLSDTEQELSVKVVFSLLLRQPISIELVGVKTALTGHSHQVKIFLFPLLGWTGRSPHVAGHGGVG